MAPACDGVVAAVLRPGVGRLVAAVLALTGDESLVAVVADDVALWPCGRAGCGAAGEVFIQMTDPLTGEPVVASRCRWHAVAWVRWLLADPHRTTEPIYVEVAAGTGDCDPPPAASVASGGVSW
jgi:hypothetical protein